MIPKQCLTCGWPSFTISPKIEALIKAVLPKWTPPSLCLQCCLFRCVPEQLHSKARAEIKKRRHSWLITGLLLKDVSKYKPNPLRRAKSVRLAKEYRELGKERVREAKKRCTSSRDPGGRCIRMYPHGRKAHHNGFMTWTDPPLPPLPEPEVTLASP